jgi:DNA-binding MarR family transcriptional regulator
MCLGWRVDPPTDHPAKAAFAPGEYDPRVGYTSWLLKRTERTVAGALYDGLRDLELTPSQYAVLQALVRLRRASSAELARALYVTPQAMTGLVASLERQRYIERRPRSSSRVIEAAATDLGREVLRQATARVERIDRDLTSRLTDAETADLREALERCLHALEGGTGRWLPVPDEPEPLDELAPGERLW